MPAYTLYCLDGDGKVLRAPDHIAAETDQQAIEYARAKKMSVRCELWDRNRLVAQIPAYPG
jgi:hypothetical protein